MQAPPDPYVLIVEDDTDSREALTEFLIDGGYLPLAVADGVEALSHLRSGGRPSLIVLDLILPRIDGWRFLAIVAESPEMASIPVVVSSGADIKANPPGVPADHILQKPLDPNALMSFVTRYCGSAFNNGSTASARKKPAMPKLPKQPRVKKNDKSPTG